MAGSLINPPFLFLHINMFMNIAEAFLLFSMGFLLGGHFVLNSLKKYAEKELIKRGILNSDNIVISENLLKIEEHSNIYYIFESKTDTFICQGNTLNETFSVLVDRGFQNAHITFNDKKFIIKDGDILELSK